METTQPTLFIWLGPTLAAMFSWGIAQGLVKKNISEVPPARFCLYFGLSNAVLNVPYWLMFGGTDVFSDAQRTFLLYGLSAYILDGIAWIFYYKSIVHGPISIVGTLSAAYPALTILLARFVLTESLTVPQYVGVSAVLLGCLALAYSPPDPDETKKKVQNRWIGFASIALLLWGVNGVIVKKAYTFEGASDGNMALCIAIGGLLTLSVYGFLYGRQGALAPTEWKRALAPMLTMSLGGLLAAIAYRHGPASIVTPLSGAYPIITLTFAMIVLKERPTRLQWGGIVAVLLGALVTVSPDLTKALGFE